MRFERRYDATVEELWNALVDPEQLKGWLGEAVFAPRIGGRVEIRFGDGPDEAGASRIHLTRQLDASVRRRRSPG